MDTQYGTLTWTDAEGESRVITGVKEIKMTEKKTNIRLNVHLGDVSDELALQMANRVANRINAVVYLIAEPDFDPSKPKGLKVRCL